MHVPTHEFNQFLVRTTLEVRCLDVLHAQRPGGGYPMHTIDDVAGDPTYEDGRPVSPELHEPLHLILVDITLAKHRTHRKVTHSEHDDVFPDLMRHWHLTQDFPLGRRDGLIPRCSPLVDVTPNCHSREDASVRQVTSNALDTIAEKRARRLTQGPGHPFPEFTPPVETDPPSSSLPTFRFRRLP